MPRLPRRYAPFAYGIIQAAITTAVATGIATYKLGGGSIDLMMFWMKTWGLAWLTMLPVVLIVAPLIQKAVLALTVAEPPNDHLPSRR